MGLETILLAGRPGDEGQGAKLAQTFIDIAKSTSARLIVAQVFTKEEYDHTTTSLGINDETEDASERIANQHRTFRTIVDRLDSEGLDYELSTAIGPHAETIVDLAAEADLVIVGGKKRSPTGKAIFGSTTQEVLLSAPCPVVYVRRE